MDNERIRGWRLVLTWRGGTAYHWGGIICSDGAKVAGIYQVCGPNGPP